MAPTSEGQAAECLERGFWRERGTKVIDMVAGAPLVTRCRAEDTDSARGLLPAKLVGLKINDPDGADYSGTITDVFRHPESGPFEGNVV